MKPTVDKILKDVQLLSKRMRTREQTADELLSKATELNLQLEAMRQYREESLEYVEIAKRAEKSPRRPLVLCLAAENKQLEQLKMQNLTLEKSLTEHQSALEMIMTKYREQISQLMRTSAVEKALQESAPSAVVAGCSDRLKDHQSSNFARQAKALTEERLLMMAAIAQEVAEQSDRYSAELETELQRLETENAGLRDLLAISTKQQQPQQSSGGDARFATVSASGFDDSVSFGELSGRSPPIGIGADSRPSGAASVFVEETPGRSGLDGRLDSFGNPQDSNFSEDLHFGILSQNKLTG